LGHTGRSKVATKLTTLSFVLVQCAALMRVFGLVIAPSYSIGWIISSAILWAFAFALFVVGYAPMLSKPALDE